LHLDPKAIDEIIHVLMAMCLSFSAAPSTAIAEPLPPIRQLVSFGDSLSAAGTYGFRFTTNPGLTFAQHLALHHGQMAFRTSIWTDIRMPSWAGPEVAAQMAWTTPKEALKPTALIRRHPKIPKGSPFQRVNS
jgi:phospholipase/lecithinase/hemolysin